MPNPYESERRREQSRRTAFSLLAVVATVCLAIASRAEALEPIPPKLVVLTFDDSVKSHFTIARPLLLQYGFGATFFVTEGVGYHQNPPAYMTWDEIRMLHDDGFEIANHLIDHLAIGPNSVDKLEEQLEGIDRRCEEFGIPKPVSFAWPGCFLTKEGLPVLEAHGILWGRRCTFPERPPTESRGFAYQPGADHPLLIPSAGTPGPGWTLEDFKAAVSLPGPGEAAIILFHGVPETEHPWVNTPQDRFEEFMEYLHENDYKVIAMRDLSRYVDPKNVPEDAWKIIEERKAAEKASPAKK